MLFMVTFPAYLMLVYETFLTRVMNARVFMGVLPKPLISMGIILFISWICWIFIGGNHPPLTGSNTRVVGYVVC